MVAMARRNDYDNTKRKVVKKNYHVSSQTAYHITQLALQEGVNEGRIIDKIMRIYLGSRSLKSF